MPPLTHRIALAVALTFAGCTCGTSPGPDASVPPVDAGETDASVPPVDAGETDAGQPDAGPGPTTTLAVTLLTLDGAPIAGATVSDGAATALTGLGGVAVLGQVAPGRRVLQVQAAGFVPAARALVVPADVGVELTLKLQALGPPTLFNAASGVNTVMQGVWVNIPAASVVDATGAPVTGTVQLTVAPVDPTTLALASAPQPLEGLPTDGGEAMTLDSVFMADVSLWRGEGEALKLAPGKTVTLGLPVPTAALARYPVGQKVAAWWFDLDAGTWVEDGEGTIMNDPSVPDGGARWVASLGHLTTWNCDQPQNTSCLMVTVLDEQTSQPISGVALETRGTSYTGTGGTVFTGSDGRACVQLRRAAAANLIATKVGYDVNTQAVTSLDRNLRCSEAASSCPPEVVRLRVGHCLKGLVTEADGTTPVALATVLARVVSPTGEVVTFSRTTGTDGSYCIPSPRSTSVRLSAQRVVANAVQTTAVKTVVTPATEAVCDGRNPCTPVTPLKFLRSCLSGRVLNHSGMPVASANVEGTYPDGMVWTRSRADGTYCLDAPRNTTVRVSAWKRVVGFPQVSNETNVTTPDAEVACGSASCAAAADLVLQGSTCLSGNVQTQSAFPAEDVTVTALLAGGGSVTADSDAMGNYCLEVPSGEGYSLVGRRTVDNLPQHTDEIIGIAQSTEAACGSGACMSLPPLTVPENACVQGQVQDPLGNPRDLAVKATWGLGATVQQVQSPGGAYCVASDLNQLVGLYVGETRGGFVNEAYTSVQSSIVRVGCGSGFCTPAATLKLPYLTCINGVVLQPGGAPYNGGFVRADFPGSGRRGDIYPGANGEFCITVPQGTPITLSAGALGSPRGFLSLTTGVGPDVACGEVGCTAAPITLQAQLPGCLTGVVVDETDAGIPGAEVLGTWRGSTGFENEYLLADSTGHYCLPTHGPTLTRLTVYDSDGGAAVTDIATTGSPMACTAVDAGCQQAPNLQPHPQPFKTCVKGRAVMNVTRGLPVLPGTKIYSYASAPAFNCQASPTTWAPVMAQSTVGANGEFCFEEPLDTAGARWLHVGGCDFTMDTQYLRAEPVPEWYVPASCGAASAWCYDLGVISVDTQPENP